MKFAFSTVGSDWTFEKIAAAAKELGYDGVELNFPSNVPAELDLHGTSAACLAGGRGAVGKRTEDKNRTAHLRSLIDCSASIGCPLVKVMETSIPPGQNRANAALVLGDWLLPLSDYAASHAVSLVLDISQSLRTARELWTILDRANHPSLGCCLDLLAAARIGDSPQVAVPMLNSRILDVQISDANDLTQSAVDCNPGHGVVPIDTAIARLRGIGYSGWMTVKWPTSSDIATERFSRALVALRAWNSAPERVKTKAKAAR